MSDTPRTDAVLNRLIDNKQGGAVDAVVLHLSRRLERELTKAQKYFNGLMEINNTNIDKIEIEQQRAEQAEIKLTGALKEIEELKQDRDNWKADAVNSPVRNSQSGEGLL